VAPEWDRSRTVVDHLDVHAADFAAGGAGADAAFVVDAYFPIRTRARNLDA
jgi:hypothetical protein